MTDTVMLSEQVGPLAIFDGALFLVLALIAGLFITNFPFTGRVKALPGYRIFAGAFFVVTALSAAIFILAFIAVAFNPSLN
jgi:hypothetical protein